jgi:hypothetical protein
VRGRRRWMIIEWTNTKDFGVAKKAVRDWTDGNHKKYWESTTGLK